MFRRGLFARLRGGFTVRRAVKVTYGTLALIPASFTLGSVANVTVWDDRPRARALALWAWTGWLSLPLSVALFAIAPVSLMTDPVDRLALDKIQRLWATLTLLPFVTVEAENEAAVKDLIEATGKGCIVVSNHRSMMDIYALFTALGIPLRFVSKKEIFFIPLVGWVMGLIGHVSLVRGDKNSGKSALENCKNALENGREWSVVFFAEGSRTTSPDESQLGEFKIGAFRLAETLGVPIVPITIMGSGEAMPPGKEMSYLGKDARIRIKVHEPIRGGGSAEELKDECRRRIQSGFN